MKTLLTLLWVVPALMLFNASLLAKDVAESPSTTITLNVGAKKISAQLPKDVSSIIRTPQDHPTFIQGTKGSESIEIGRSDDFDIYSIQVFDPAALTEHGHKGAVTDLDAFIATEIEHYRKQYDVKERDKRLPESLQAIDSKTDRYVLVSGAYNKQKNLKPEKQKTRKVKQFLWRVMLVDGQIVMAQRELGGGYAGKNKIDPKNEKEWEFLTSLTVE